MSATQAFWVEGVGDWRWLDAGYEWDFYAFMGNTMVRNTQNTRDEEARVKKSITFVVIRLPLFVQIQNFKIISSVYGKSPVHYIRV